MNTAGKRVEPETELPDDDTIETNEITLEEFMPDMDEEDVLDTVGGDGSTGTDEAPADVDLSDDAAAAAILAELEAERDEYKDKYMRAVAEAENVRRRAERDKVDAQTYGGTKLARDLLSVHDNLQRAMDAADDELREKAAAFLEGVELTHRELLNAFAKHKIEKVSPEKGDRFDPNRHQAMFEAPIPGAENGTVIEVMQAGFVIADRLLRPALVGVAKGAPEEPAKELDTKA